MFLTAVSKQDMRSGVARTLFNSLLYLRTSNHRWRKWRRDQERSHISAAPLRSRVWSAVGH